MDRKGFERLERRFRRIAKTLGPAVLQQESTDCMGAADLDRFLQTKASAYFLGFYSEEGLRAGLERYGFWERLQERNLTDIELSFDLDDPYLHRLTVYCDASSGHRQRLVDLKVRMIDRPTEYAFEQELGDYPVDFLYIESLVLQNPHKPFAPNRPRLPGQEHPGLGVGWEVFELLVLMGERLKVAGVVNIPAWYHNAYLYNVRSRFLTPEMEGLFRALYRDLGERNLVEASWAVQGGCVSNRDTGEVFTWQGREQLYALRKRMIHYFGSSEYRRRRRRTAADLHFVVDERKLAQVLEAEATRD